MRKIDIYVPKSGQWIYVCTTTQAKTCKEAITRYKEQHGIAQEHQNVKALYSKDHK